MKLSTSKIRPERMAAKSLDGHADLSLRLEVFDSGEWRLIGAFPVQDQLAVMEAASALQRVLGSQNGGMRVVDGRATMLESRPPHFKWRGPSLSGML